MHYTIVNKLGQMLLDNIKNKMPELEELLEKINSHWHYEDMVYRFYHHSFKVYYVQGDTIEIVAALKKLTPDMKKLKEEIPDLLECIESISLFNSQFDDIIKKGTGKVFKSIHNKNWDKHTKPLLESFFHAKFFLEMAVKYGKELETAPNCLPSGWAALLYMYNLR